VIPTVDETNELLATQYPSAHAAGYRCVAIAPGRALARWTYDATTLRPGGLIAGPTQFALADLALWFLSFTVLGLAPMAVTSDVHICFLRPAAAGDLLAEATVLRAGKNRIFGGVRLWIDGARDRPVANVVGGYARLG
jgi:uncharacterized protein (TIGR00369 family)